MHDEDDWTRLGDTIRARREELLLSQSEAVRRSEGLLSLPTWGLLERAQQDSYKRRSLRGVEVALGWPAGACARILAGADLDATALAEDTTSTAAAELPVGLARRLAAAPAADRERAHAVLDAVLPPLAP